MAKHRDCHLAENLLAETGALVLTREAILGLKSRVDLPLKAFLEARKFRHVAEISSAALRLADQVYRNGSVEEIDRLEGFLGDVRSSLYDYLDPIKMDMDYSDYSGFRGAGFTHEEIVSDSEARTNFNINERQLLGFSLAYSRWKNKK